MSSVLLAGEAGLREGVPLLSRRPASVDGFGIVLRHTVALAVLGPQAARSQIRFDDPV